MKFAEHQGEKIEATPKARGICLSCGENLIAKCGPKIVWHWSHRSKTICDSWWENETQWHRDWKNQFPREWQETLVADDNGNRHFADIRTPNGLVVEFQHSYLSARERQKRVKFYKRLIWVIDGKRRITDFSKFEGARKRAIGRKFGSVLYERLNRYNSRLVDEWYGQVAAFDFGRETIWLLKNSDNNWGFGYEMEKEEFLKRIRVDQPFQDAIFAIR